MDKFHVSLLWYALMNVSVLRNGHWGAFAARVGPRDILMSGRMSVRPRQSGSDDAGRDALISAGQNPREMVELASSLSSFTGLLDKLSTGTKAVTEYKKQGTLLLKSFGCSDGICDSSSTRYTEAVKQVLQTAKWIVECQPVLVVALPYLTVLTAAFDLLFPADSSKSFGNSNGDLIKAIRRGVRDTQAFILEKEISDIEATASALEDTRDVIEYQPCSESLLSEIVRLDDNAHAMMVAVLQRADRLNENAIISEAMDTSLTGPEERLKTIRLVGSMYQAWCQTAINRMRLLVAASNKFQNGCDNIKQLTLDGGDTAIETLSEKMKALPVLGKITNHSGHHFFSHGSLMEDRHEDGESGLDDSSDQLQPAFSHSSSKSAAIGLWNRLVVGFVHKVMGRFQKSQALPTWAEKQTKIVELTLADASKETMLENKWASYQRWGRVDQLCAPDRYVFWFAELSLLKKDLPDVAPAVDKTLAAMKHYATYKEPLILQGDYMGERTRGGPTCECAALVFKKNGKSKEKKCRHLYYMGELGRGKLCEACSAYAMFFNDTLKDKSGRMSCHDFDHDCKGCLQASDPTADPGVQEITNVIGARQGSTCVYTSAWPEVDTPGCYYAFTGLFGGTRRSGGGWIDEEDECPAATKTWADYTSA